MMIYRPYFLQRNLRSAKSSGFSIAEILVSIFIIALLAVLTISGIGRLQEKGQSAICLSNLRQFGAGINLYAGEHNGFLPPARDAYYNPSYTVLTWYNYSGSWAYQYIDPVWPRGLRIFRCPADRTTSAQSRYYSYTCNNYYLQDWDYGKPQALYVYSGYVRLEKAMNKVLMLDGGSKAEGCLGADSNGVNDVFNYGNITSVISKRHNGGVNCLFGDGSARWMSKSDLTFSVYGY